MQLRTGKLRFSFIVALALLTALIISSSAQQPATVVPTLVNFNGTLRDLDGKPITQITGVTFSLFKDEQGGAPLWMETQNVAPDRNGHYTVALGSTTAEGLPTDVFASGEARWLAVQAEGQPEQPRILLLSVPYALKAGDAQTVGGLPASAFVLAAPGTAGTNSAGTAGDSANPSGAAPAASNASSDVTTTGGTVNAIPLFSTSTNIQNSILSQTGTTAIDIAGALDFPALGTATSSKSYNSRPQDFVASVYSSTSKAAVAQTFQLQAEPLNNDKSTASGTLNLLYGSGTTTPAETGLKIANTGVITFATGQTFPGTGDGTITGITTASGSGLTGGGTSGTLSLSIPAAGVNNTMLKDSSVTLNANSAGGLTTPGAMSLGSTYAIGLKPCTTNQILQYSGSAWNCASAGTGTITGVTAGSDLTGGGTGGNVTLNVDTTKVPLLASANIFSTGQTISATGSVDGLDVSAASGNGITATSTSGVGLSGGSTNSTGVAGATGSSQAYGVSGVNLGGGVGVSASGLTGVSAESTTCCTGYGGEFYGYSAQSGSNNNGTDGVLSIGGSPDPSATYGVGGGSGVVGFGGSASSGLGAGGFGVVGYGGDGPDSDGLGGVFVGGDTNGSGTGDGDGIDGIAGSGYAGSFYGDVYVAGTLSKSSGSFKIDHPLDPANKYLYHSFVESPDMMNVYNGNVVLDANGGAVVEFPDWFGVLNRDFRYQLTCIGGFAPVYVAEEISNNHFTIAGGRPGLKVSWQVTGIRQDAWANAHRIPVEEEKEARLKGFYIHPELYGAPPEKQIEWARHPQMMKRMKEQQHAPHPAAAPVALPAPVSATTEQALKARK